MFSLALQENYLPSRKMVAMDVEEARKGSGAQWPGVLSCLSSPCRSTPPPCSTLDDHTIAPPGSSKLETAAIRDSTHCFGSFLMNYRGSVSVEDPQLQLQGSLQLAWSVKARLIVSSVVLRSSL